MEWCDEKSVRKIVYNSILCHGKKLSVQFNVFIYHHIYWIEPHSSTFFLAHVSCWYSLFYVSMKAFFSHHHHRTTSTTTIAQYTNFNFISICLSVKIKLIEIDINRCIATGVHWSTATTATDTSTAVGNARLLLERDEFTHKMGLDFDYMDNSDEFEEGVKIKRFRRLESMFQICNIPLWCAVSFF